MSAAAGPARAGASAARWQGPVYRASRVMVQTPEGRSAALRAKPQEARRRAVGA